MKRSALISRSKVALASIVGLLTFASTPSHAGKSLTLTAYVHHVVTGAGGNLCANDTTHLSTVLNNPLINGNPNAVITATYNEGNTSSGSVITAPGPVAVYYDDANICGNALNRWVLLMNTSNSALVDADSFNIVAAVP